MTAPLRKIATAIVALLALVAGLSALGARVDARPSLSGPARVVHVIACVDGGELPATDTAAYDRHVCAYGV